MILHGDFCIVISRVRNTLLRGRSDGCGPSTVCPVRSGRVINKKDGKHGDTACTGDRTGNALLCVVTHRGARLQQQQISLRLSGLQFNLTGR